MSNMAQLKGFLHVERDWLKSRLQNIEQGVFLEINNHRLLQKDWAELGCEELTPPNPFLLLRVLISMVLSFSLYCCYVNWRLGSTVNIIHRTPVLRDKDISSSPLGKAQPTVGKQHNSPHGLVNLSISYYSLRSVLPHNLHVCCYIFFKCFWNLLWVPFCIFFLTAQ